jgi:hypothetical protein
MIEEVVYSVEWYQNLGHEVSQDFANAMDRDRKILGDVTKNGGSATS